MCICIYIYICVGPYHLCTYIFMHFLITSFLTEPFNYLMCVSSLLFCDTMSLFFTRLFVSLSPTFSSVCLRIMITSSIDLARFDRANKYNNNRRNNNFSRPS